MAYFTYSKFIVSLSIIALFVSCKLSQPTQTDIATVQKDSTQTDFLVPIEESEKKFDNLPEPVWKPKKGDYHASATKYFDLLHTKLELKPDWEKQWLYGTATLTVEPYFYAQDKIDLQAKALSIEYIKILEGKTTKNLRWDYDGELLTVRLDRSYKKGEKLNVEISYIAKPNEALWANSAVQTIEEEGLYFINPENKTKGKPQQIWTQGETSNNSMWFPTFDYPNYRGTQEVYLTVENRFKTLSNGKLVSTQTHADGTRTDYWRMEKPHAPYLTMIVVGEFEVIEDKWRNVPLYYYTEKWHAPYAKDVFGNTPKMMEFFSTYLDYPYPWEKYGQVIVRDYTSGAMENTSASVFMEGLLVDKRSIQDHSWDGIVAHELFHQWFGDLLTSESWANLTMNEAFAEYGEYLWFEHSKGRKDADRFLMGEEYSYLREAQAKREPLIRYFYTNENDMFDNHSYAKGCMILNMLRSQIGDEAFQTVLQKYIKKHAFSAVESHDLRLVVEEVTGQDWLWFFEQWFLKAGHPEITISKMYENNTLALMLSQTQDTRYASVYRLPISVDIWVKGQKITKEILFDKTEQIFEFQLATAPELVVVDPSGYLLADISEDKTAQEWRLQAQYYDSYIAKWNAIYQLASSVDSDTTRNLLFELTQNPYYAYREQAIRSLGEYKAAQDQQKLITLLKKMARNDENNLVRASALDVLSGYGEFRDLWLDALNDSSYFVLSNTIYSLANAYGGEALEHIEKLESIEERHVVYALAEYYSFLGIENKYEWLESQLSRTSGTELSYLLNHFTQYLINQPEQVRNMGIDYLVTLAKTNSNFQTRKDAYQSLIILTTSVENLDISTRLEQIRNEEKDRRVIEYQQALGF